MKFAYELPVQFRDIDCLGHVNSATYLQYMESARIEFMRSLGFISGFRPPFIVAASRCEYQNPIVDERRVAIYLWVSRVGNRSWDFDYAVQGLDGTLFAIGRTTQAAFDYDSASTVPIADEVRKQLEGCSAEPLSFKDAVRRAQEGW